MTVPELREKIREMEMEALESGDTRVKDLLEKFGDSLVDDGNDDTECPWCRRSWSSVY